MLNVPVKFFKQKEYNCSTCGANDSLQVQLDPIYNHSLDVCQKCGSIYRKNFADENSWNRFLKSYHRSLPNYQYWLKDIINGYMVDKLLEHDPNDRLLWIDSGIGVGAKNIKIRHITKCQPTESHYLMDKSLNGGDCRNTINIKDKMYNTIIFLDYIQYIPNPVEYLKSLRDKMADDGLMLFSAPIIDLPSHDLCCAGIADTFYSIFTADTLKNLILAAGFDIETEYTQYKNPVFVLKKATSVHPLKIVKGSAEKVAIFKKVIQLIAKQKYEEVKRISKQIPDAYMKIKFDSPEEFDKVAVMAEVAEATEIFGDHIPIIGQIGQFYYLMQNYDEAARIFLFILEFTADPMICELLAQCMYDMGVYDEAEKYFKMAIELSPPQSEEMITKLASSIYAMREFNEVESE